MDKISLRAVMHAWETKFNEIPSVTILNSEQDNSWSMIIRKRSSKRGSIATFTDQNYLGVLKKALIAGNDIKYMNRVNKSFVEGAKTLKDLRIKLNVSQSEISKMLGITQPVYSDLEQAKIKISDEIMQKVKELSMV